jgi:hypothetical protein
MASASSSNARPPDYFADPTQDLKIVAKVEVEGELLSFEGRLHLDRVAAGSWVLTDTLSCDIVTLRGHGFDLVEVDGSAAVIETDEQGIQASIRDVEDIFQNLVFVNPSGERYVQHKNDNGTVVTVSFDNQLAKHREAFVKFNIGVGNASVDLTASAFLRPRTGNQRLFFSLFDIYKILGLTTFSGQPSKWVHQSKKPWMKFFASLGMGALLIQSSHSNISDTARVALPWHERCLPSPACSSMGTLALLLRFVSLAKEKGGLDGVGQRELGRVVLRKLLEECCKSAKTVCIPIVLDVKWQCRWPRPCEALLYGQMSIKMSISEDGRCTLGELRSCALAGNSVAKRWFKHIIKVAGLQESASSIALQDLLAGLVGHESSVSLLGQILWHLSLNLERNLGMQERSSDKGAHVVHFKWTTFDDALDGSAHSLDRKLAQYVVASVEHSLLHPTFSMATDGGNIGALPLQMSFIVFPDGVAALCCPAVLVAHILRPGHSTSPPVSVSGGLNPVPGWQ